MPATITYNAAVDFPEADAVGPVAVSHSFWSAANGGAFFPGKDLAAVPAALASGQAWRFPAGEFVITIPDGDFNADWAEMTANLIAAETFYLAMHDGAQGDDGANEGRRLLVRPGRADARQLGHRAELIMADVTITLGAPATIAATYVQWENRDPPVGLGEVSALSSDADPRYIQRVRIWRSDRAGGYMYVNAKRTTPDGSNAFSSGDNFNDDWAVNPGALVFTAPNGVLTVDGPNAPGSRVADANEPYSWSPPEPFADIETWINAYIALNATDQSMLTLRLADLDAFLALDAAPSTMGAMTSSAATVTIVDAHLALDAAPSTMGAMTSSAATVTIVDAHLALDAAPSTMGAMTSSAATVTIRQAATTVEAAANADQPRAVITHKTNRLDLLARAELGSDSDANRRNLIRRNAARFAERPTFWLEPGETILTAPPEPTS